MSIVEWFFIGAIILFFVTLMLYSWADLFKDLRYYKGKRKNVSHIDSHKKHARKVKK